MDAKNGGAGLDRASAKGQPQHVEAPLEAAGADLVLCRGAEDGLDDAALDAALAAEELEQLLVRGVANTSDLRRDRLLHLLRQLQLLGADLAQLPEDHA